MRWASNNKSDRSEKVRKDAYLLMPYLLGIVTFPFSIAKPYSNAAHSLIWKNRGIMFSQKKWKMFCMGAGDMKEREKSLTC